MPAAAPIVFVVMIETREGKRGVYAVRATEARAEYQARVASLQNFRAWYVPMPVDG